MNTLQQSPEAKITSQMISSLRSTRPWTKFLAILGFIGAGLFVVIGLLLMFVKNVFPPANNAPTFIMGFLYIIFSSFYFFPSFYLFKYSSSVHRFLTTSRENEMESALSYQKSFWRFLGIMTLVMLVIGLLGIVAAAAIPMFIKMRAHQAV